MANMLDYVRDCGRLRFGEIGFTALDNLVLSQLSYVDYAAAGSSLPLRLDQLEGRVRYGVMNENNKSLFHLAASSPRFSGSLAAFYRSDFSREDTCQFAAVTFLLEDGSAFVSFRGTDSTLVGWKEDFMLSFTTPVPAQLAAVQYANEVGEVLGCPLRLGGHSKGGNLAVYAAAFCQKTVQDKIVQVYSNDGPGFEQQVLQSVGYLNIRSRVRRYLPEASMVGMLMDSDSEVCVVKSTGHGPFRHNPYTWQVQGSAFVPGRSETFTSHMVLSSQKDWFASLSREKRETYTDLLFDILFAGNARTMKELRSDPAKIVSAARAIAKLPPEDRKNLTEFGKQVLSSLYAGGSTAAKQRYETVLEAVRAKIGLSGE